jgi:hypothetical protein
VCFLKQSGHIGFFAAQIKCLGESGKQTLNVHCGNCAGHLINVATGPLGKKLPTFQIMVIVTSNPDSVDRPTRTLLDFYSISGRETPTLRGLVAGNDRVELCDPDSLDSTAQVRFNNRRTAKNVLS